MQQLIILKVWRLSFRIWRVAGYNGTGEIFFQYFGEAITYIQFSLIPLFSFII